MLATVFVPEAFGKIGGVARKALKINKIDGAGRGNRTPMESLPTDFEFPENTVCL
jgi:hypothetical protein